MGDERGYRNGASSLAGLSLRSRPVSGRLVKAARRASWKGSCVSRASAYGLAWTAESSSEGADDFVVRIARSTNETVAPDDGTA